MNPCYPPGVTDIDGTWEFDEDWDDGDREADQMMDAKLQAIGEVYYEGVLKGEI